MGAPFSRELLFPESKGVKARRSHFQGWAFRAVDVEDLSTQNGFRTWSFHSSALTINGAKAAAGKRFLQRNRFPGATLLPPREITAYSWTNKLIFPPYDFCIPDALITNFQLPQSTMLMFVAAFGGYDTVMKAYETAVKEKYRFGGYGDAMLII